MSYSRRQFLQQTLQLGAAAAVMTAVPMYALAERSSCLLSARSDAAGQHFWSGYTENVTQVF
ncbi:MAG TPA: twin-arginine translocation signal domain-containing protein, partial [Pseudomonadales bacterium]|nr:twin-arginine translocation signal domain-containing protein [Pseudomonadales bacterium]